MRFKLSLFFKYLICPKKLGKLKNIFDVFNIFRKKFFKKFDVIYYLRKVKKDKLFKKILMNSQQIKFFNLIGKKNYLVELSTENFKNKIVEEDKEKKSKIFEYLLASSEKRFIKHTERILIDDFLG